MSIEPMNQGAASLDQIHLLCETFVEEQEAADSSAPSPAIKDYLNQVAKDAQPTLLRNLLHIEIERRKRAGETPDADEYIGWLPEHGSIIRQAFDCTIGASLVDDTDQGQTHTFIPPAVRQLGDYELLRELGRGAMGMVYEARHLQRGNRLALKTLPQVDATALHRFKREFRAVADVNHLNLVGVHSLESDGCHWFFTMDMVSGTDWNSYVCPHGKFDHAKLRSGLSQLVEGVSALHAHQIIHRDLKPANVMVSSEGRVVILDFGLVLEMEQSTVPQSMGVVAGTPLYMAPEQAAGGDISESSDWYAVGVMLYQALCGRPPFRGSVLSILQDKREKDAPELPDDIDQELQDLKDICQQLVARCVADRPTERQIRDVVTSDSDRVTVQAISETLVGREAQSAILDQAYRELRKDKNPQTVFVSGRSGEGKTSLISHFLKQIRLHGEVTILSGRCYDRESVPFKALDSLIDSLANHLRSMSETDAALLMPYDINILATVFPVLRRVSVVEKSGRSQSDQLDETQVRRRAFDALRELLLRLSDRSCIIMSIDDLQWGDADSAEVMFEILRPPNPPTVMFLGAYRSDEAENSPFLKKWDELERLFDVEITHQDIVVSPLTLEQCTEVVAQLLQCDPLSVRDEVSALYEETGGNPYLAVEMAGCYDPAAGVFRLMPMNEMIEQKLQRLPPEACALLNVVSVSGQAVDLLEASHTAGHQSVPMTTLTHMRNERLVRIIDDDGVSLVDTYHDKIRETALQQLDSGRRLSLHSDLAATIENSIGADAEQLLQMVERDEASDHLDHELLKRTFDLAYHFDAAGTERKALVYGLLGAEQARRQFGLVVASEQYMIATRNSQHASNDVKFRIAEGHGGVCLALGHYEEAKRVLEDSLDVIEDDFRKARLEVLLGSTEFRRGEIGRSVDVYKRGLSRVGSSMPKSAIGYSSRILLEILTQTIHTLFPSRLHKTPSTNQGDLRIKFLCGLYLPLVFESTHKMLWAHLQALNRCEKVPETGLSAVTYALHGMMMAMLGWHSRGKKYLDRSLRITRQSEDLSAQSYLYMYAMVGCVASSRYTEGISLGRDLVDTCEKSGEVWVYNVGMFHLACCHFGLGDLRSAIIDARRSFESCARLNDSRTMCASYIWARATGGNIPFEKIRFHYPDRPDDVMSTVHGLFAEGQWHGFHGRTAESLACFEDAASRIWHRQCINSHMIMVMPMLASALRRHSETVEATDPAESARLRKRSLRLARWAVRITRFFPGAYPVSLRELSLIYSLFGKTRKALKYADKSCSIAEKQQATYEHAQSLLLRGQLAHKLGRSEGEQQIETARGELEKFSIMIEEASTIA